MLEPEERGSRPSSERYINIYRLAVHVRSKRTWNGINSRHSSSRQKNWQKIVMPLKSCCFAHYTYCVFWYSYCHRSFIRSLLIHFTSLQFSFAVRRQVAGDFVLSETQPRDEYELSNVYVAVIISKKYNLVYRLLVFTLFVIGNVTLCLQFFLATCLAAELGNKLHENLPDVTAL